MLNAEFNVSLQVLSLLLLSSLGHGGLKQYGQVVILLVVIVKLRSWDLKRYWQIVIFVLTGKVDYLVN